MPRLVGAPTIAMLLFMDELLVSPANFGYMMTADTERMRRTGGVRCRPADQLRRSFQCAL